MFISVFVSDFDHLLMSDRSLSPRASRRRSHSHSRSRSRSRSPRRVRVRSKRIVVANVPYDVSWQKIKELFREQCGFTGYLEMLTMHGKPMGMGVMEFRTYEGAEKAIEKMHRFPIGDRKLVVREETNKDRERIEQCKGSSNGGGGVSMAVGGGMMGPGGGALGPVGGNAMDRQAANNAAMQLLTPQILQQLGIEGPLTSSIYISNLDFKVTWQKLKDVFRLAGRVSNVDLKTDANGKSRGFAVVKFDHPFEAVQAISMFNNQLLFDRPMRIRMDKEAQVHMANAPNPGARLPEGLQGIGMGLGIGGQPVKSMQDVAMFAQGQGPRGMGGPMGDDMGGPQSVDGGGILGGASVMGMPPRDNRNFRPGGISGGGGGILGSSGINNDMMQMRGMPRGPGGMGDHMGGMGGMNMSMSGGNMGLMSESVLGNASGMPGGGFGGHGGFGGRGGRGGDSVIVRNLPFSYTWQDLKRSFRDVGDVRFAEICLDSNKRSKGVGIVRFNNPDDARRAVSMLDGARFDGRNILVELE